MTDTELYEGFSPERIERYEREAREIYDPKLVEEANRRIRRMSPEEWAATKAEGSNVTEALAELMDRPPNDAEVQTEVARHHAWIERFYPASAGTYRGLGQGYAQHPEFRAYYEKVRPGLADFMAAAMAVYADEVLMPREVAGAEQGNQSEY